MLKTKSAFYLQLCLLLVFAACASTPARNDSGSNNTGSNTAAGNINSAPSWVRDPYTKFDRQANVAAVGSGSSRQAADKDALGKLIAFFGQSIQVDQKVSSFYQEAVKNGVTAFWSENTAVDSVITTSAGMDSLIGAEIGEAWGDGRGTIYAVAVLNKSKAIQVYSNLVKSNQQIIENLVNLSASEKNTFDGFARYQFAATIADVTFSYGNLLTQIGAPSLAQGLKKGDEYRLEAQNITKAIPVGIAVKNDKSGRIQSAFAKALSELGFRSGGNNSRYMLVADVTVSPVDLPNNQNKFARIELSANLADTGSGSVLLPYSFNSREGHTSVTEAENRAYTAAEKKINEEYRALLSDYLSGLIPKK